MRIRFWKKSETPDGKGEESRTYSAGEPATDRDEPPGAAGPDQGELPGEPAADQVELPGAAGHYGHVRSGTMPRRFQFRRPDGKRQGKAGADAPRRGFFS